MLEKIASIKFGRTEITVYRDEYGTIVLGGLGWRTKNEYEESKHNYEQAQKESECEERDYDREQDAKREADAELNFKEAQQEEPNYPEGEESDGQPTEQTEIEDLEGREQDIYPSDDFPED